MRKDGPGRHGTSRDASVAAAVPGFASGRPSCPEASRRPCTMRPNTDGCGPESRGIPVKRDRRMESVGSRALAPGYLTAPRVSPAMKCFCIRKNIRTGGRAATIEPALIRW